MKRLSLPKMVAAILPAALMLCSCATGTVLDGDEETRLWLYGIEYAEIDGHPHKVIPAKLFVMERDFIAQALPTGRAYVLDLGEIMLSESDVTESYVAMEKIRLLAKPADRLKLIADAGIGFPEELFQQAALYQKHNGEFIIGFLNASLVSFKQTRQEGKREWLRLILEDWDSDEPESQTGIH
jgi:hypothetical protein